MRNNKWMARCRYKLYYCEWFPFELLGDRAWRHSGTPPKEHVARLMESLMHERMRNPIVVDIQSGGTARVHPGKSRCLALHNLGIPLCKAVVRCEQGQAFPFPELHYYEISARESEDYFVDDIIVEYDHRHWAAKSVNRRA